MERYTERTLCGQAIVKSKDINIFAEAMNRFAAYEDICLNADGTERISINRLLKLAEADSKGLVRILPYSVLAYKIYTKRNRHGNIHKRIMECINYGFPESEIGKTVFLTREAAESALKAGEPR